MVVTFFKGAKSFYFSYTYDLTHTIQRLDEQSSLPSQTHLDKRDKRFLWNSYLLKNLNLDRNMSPFMLPIVLGFVSINRARLNGRFVDFSLISRRSCLNAGTRYNVRGSNPDGDVANFVETEQIVSCANAVCSYVLIRGSIPLSWTQRSDLSHKPPFIIGNFENQIKVCQKHFASTQPIYKRQVCVNLINQHGSESALELNFNEVLKRVNEPLVRYEAFDFHKECGSSRWSRLDILANNLSSDQKSFEYYSKEKNAKHAHKTQSGVFRVNCIDCLDRTNVVQGILAKKVLNEQLVMLNVLNTYDSIESCAEFYSVFRNVWADNGDTMSIQYAGTGALKSDFTRKGKRTYFGMLRDINNSIFRYFINNFYDGFRQDSIDVVLGNYEVKSAEGLYSKNSPLAVESTSHGFFLKAVLFLFIVSILVLYYILSWDDSQRKFYYIVGWMLVEFYFLKFIFRRGASYVDNPKLYQMLKSK